MQALLHRLRDHGKAVAAQYGRPYFPPEGKYDKEDRARETIERDHIDFGLVGVMAARKSIFGTNYASYGLAGLVPIKVDYNWKQKYGENTTVEFDSDTSASWEPDFVAEKS